MKRGVTMIELLFVMMILGILVGVAWSGLTAAINQARIERTRAIVKKLDQIIMEKWEAYKTRAVPIKIPAGTDPIMAARWRLYALRELQRLEMPDRKNDVLTSNAMPLSLNAWPSLNRNYRRRATSTWSDEYEGAECLYLIISAMRDGEDSALSFFQPNEIGDVDGDGMHEILDAFGQPIEFLRWPRGYVQENEVVTPITSDATIAPDPFDPLHADPRWSDNDPVFAPFAIKPLIFSTSGNDPLPHPNFPPNTETYDIRTGRSALDYSVAQPPSPANDPYIDLNPPLGAPLTQRTGYVSYITNHDFGEK